MSVNFDQWTSIRPGSRGLTVALAGAEDAAALRAMKTAAAIGVKLLLVGAPERVRRAADAAGLDEGGVTVVPPEGPASDEQAACSAAARLCAEGRADALMKGRVGTGAFVRSVLEKRSGLIRDGALLSHIGLFSDPRNGRSFVLTDAAINISPDVEEKKVILANAVRAMRVFGEAAPRIALLAPVEKPSSNIASTVDAVILREWIAHGGLDSAVADGPMGLDIAASEEAARTKGIDSPVAGKADILLAQNLDAGNILYKALTVFARAAVAGIVAGAAVPVILPSRSDSDEVKLASLGLGLNIAAARKTRP